MAGIITPAYEKMMQQLLIVDSLRGTDSTGIAVVNNQGFVRVAKALGGPQDLFDTNQYTKALQGQNCVIIGHNRYATQGAVSRKNAHPFEFDALVGAHNGTLTYKHNLLNAKDYAVDSENLFHHIAEKGVEDALSKVGGAWALVWWDKVGSTLNFLRNKERPLFYCYDEEGDAIFWASEYWMLSGVLSRNGVKFEKIEMLAEDTHASIKINPNTRVLSQAVTSYEPGTFTPPVYVPPTVYKPPALSVVPPYTSSPTAPWNDKDTKNTTSTKVCTVVAHKSDRNGAMFLALEDDTDREIRFYYSSYLDTNPLDLLGEEVTCTINNYRISSRQGIYYSVVPSSVQLVECDKPKLGICQWCTVDIFKGERHALTHQGELLCKDCVADPDVAQYIPHTMVN